MCMSLEGNAGTARDTCLWSLGFCWQRIALIMDLVTAESIHVWMVDILEEHGSPVNTWNRIVHEWIGFAKTFNIVFAHSIDFKLSILYTDRTENTDDFVDGRVRVGRHCLKMWVGLYSFGVTLEECDDTFRSERLLFLWEDNNTEGCVLSVDVLLTAMFPIPSNFVIRGKCASYLLWGIVEY